MTDPHFRHDRDGHGFDDFFDQPRVTLRIYLVTVVERVRWDRPFERHRLPYLMSFGLGELMKILTLDSDVGGNSFKCHHCTCSSFLGNSGLDRMR